MSATDNSRLDALFADLEGIINNASIATVIPAAPKPAPIPQMQAAPAQAAIPAPVPAAQPAQQRSQAASTQIRQPVQPAAAPAPFARQVKPAQTRQKVIRQPVQQIPAIRSPGVFVRMAADIASAVLPGRRALGQTALGALAGILFASGIAVGSYTTAPQPAIAGESVLASYPPAVSAGPCEMAEEAPVAHEVEEAAPPATSRRKRSAR